jgi:hypothetical protein
MALMLHELTHVDIYDPDYSPAFWLRMKELESEYFELSGRPLLQAYKHEKKRIVKHYELMQEMREADECKRQQTTTN